MDTERFRPMLREPVRVTFSDGGTEAGWLAGIHADSIEVEHIDMTGGGHVWTAAYSMTGDDDTPHVVDVVRYESPTDGRYEQGELFA